MIEQDTVRLLRECDSGAKMGVGSIDEVLGSVKNESLMKCLQESKAAHKELQEELDKLLFEYHDEGKEPSPMAKGMSWMTINAKLVMHETDATIASLITDGCGMGVKKLSGFLNQYAAADEKSKDICKRLIRIEEKLEEELRDFL